MVTLKEQKHTVLKRPYNRMKIELTGMTAEQPMLFLHKTIFVQEKIFFG